MPNLLTPLPQHRALVAWLQTYEPDVWAHFASAERHFQNSEDTRLALLRDTYRMDAEVHADVFQEIAAAKLALGLEVEVQAYQAEGTGGANAAICYLPGEAHLIFSGPILSLLSPEELRGVIGHELAHFALWQLDDGAYFVADRILHATAAHPGAAPSHEFSARLWSLATELFADRGAYLATQDLETAVACLIKTTTGAKRGSGKSYLAQAEELFAKSRPKSERATHPETFMRARALQLWVNEAEDLEEIIADMLQADDGLDGLDLIQQSELATFTQQFLESFLKPKWFQSEAVLAHARAYFPEFKPATTADPVLLDQACEWPAGRRDYLCQVMLDFCLVDPDLETMPVAAAFEFARSMECLGAFEKLANRELKIKAKDLKKLKETAAALLSNAATPEVVKP